MHAPDPQQSMQQLKILGALGAQRRDWALGCPLFMNLGLTVALLK